MPKRKASDTRNEKEIFSEFIVFDESTGCWNWGGNRDVRGYGRFFDNKTKKYVKAYRKAWEIWNGKIPPGSGFHGTCVCHHCDNPACVNPKHLFIGSVYDNNRDRTDKGRTARQTGESHGHAKLTREIVEEIRRSNEYQHVIAKRYNISQTNVSLIKTKRTWK